MKKRYANNVLTEFKGKHGRSYTISLGNIVVSFAERNASERRAFNRIDNGDNLVDIVNEYYGKLVV